MKDDQERWIKLHLSSLDNPLFQRDPTAWHIFETCLLLAYPKGSFTIGRDQLSRASGVKGPTAYKALKRLEKMQMVNNLSNNRFTTISICNWDKYQTLGNNSVNNKVTTGSQQSNNTVTHLENKNKKEKNTTQSLELAEWIEHFNLRTGRSFKPTSALLPNFNKWRETYSLEEMRKAVDQLPRAQWNVLRENPKPDLLLRTMDTNRQPVDRIGELLNHTSQPTGITKHIESPY